MAEFADDFSGSGALSASWSVQGFNTASRVNGVVDLPDYSWNRVVDPFDTTAQVGQFTKVTGNLMVSLSSLTLEWGFPLVDGYTVTVRSDGVVEAWANDASLGYEFITVDDGSVVRVEHDGDHIIRLYDDDVLIKTWDNSADPIPLGNYVWLSGGPGTADMFYAADIGGTPPTSSRNKFFNFL